MPKYVLEFSKCGYIKYISHLDLQRLFKRAFRRAGIPLSYSHGFNPHPKMSLCQPLSLGYEAECEWLEFETDKNIDKITCTEDLQYTLPEGINIKNVGKVNEKKSIAASIKEAEYEVRFPIDKERKDFNELLRKYLAQDEIIVKKKQKKKKELKTVNIRNKIKNIEIINNDERKLALNLILDCGSSSNLSPELVINSFIEFGKLICFRYDIEVLRKRMILPIDYDIEWM